MSRENPRAPLELLSATPLAPPADFEEKLRAEGVTIDAEATAKIGDFLARLIANNALLNLTSIVDPVDVWTRHALDALTLVPHIASLAAGGEVLDVGSGGGVPAIPLAIVRRDLHFTLIEATQKKAAFLYFVAEALELDNVTIYAERAEEMARGELAGEFDVVCSRAVAKIDALVPWTAPFARNEGKLLFIKGQRAEQELLDAKATLKRFRCEHESTKLTATGRVVTLVLKRR